MSPGRKGCPTPAAPLTPWRLCGTLGPQGLPSPSTSSGAFVRPDTRPSPRLHLAVSLCSLHSGPSGHTGPHSTSRDSFSPRLRSAGPAFLLH